VVSVCPYIRNISIPTGRIFIKLDIYVFFENMERKFKFHYNRTKITGSLHDAVFTYMIIPRSIRLRTRNASHEKCTIKTHILCPTTFFSKIVSFRRQCGKTW